MNKFMEIILTPVAAVVAVATVLWPWLLVVLVVLACVRGCS